MNHLPPGWSQRPLSEVAEACLGKMLDRAKNTSGRKLPYLRNINVRWFGVDTSDLEEMFFDVREMERYGLCADDVLVCEGGEPGRAAVWDGRASAMKFQKAIHRVRPSKALLPQWLVYHLKADADRGALEPSFTGTTIKHFTGTSLAKYEIPLPPIAEQRRIVAKIESLFARSRRAKEVLVAIPPLLDQLRQSLFVVALRGDLTSDLRKRSSASASAKAGTAGFWEIPAGWNWVRVDQAGEVQLGRQRSPKDHSGPHMHPYLRVANVFEDRIDTGDVMAMNFSPEEFKRFRLESGDVLLNEGQSLDLVGRPAIYRGEVPGACFQNTLVRFRATARVLPEFALLVFRAYLQTGRFSRIASWTTNIAHLGAGRLAAMPFPLPPPAEQEEIVLRTTKRLASIATIGDAISGAQADLASLQSSILAKAFRGELAPQDPNDEPAFTLLERLRAAKTAASVKPSSPAGARIPGRQKVRAARS